MKTPDVVPFKVSRGSCKSTTVQHIMNLLTFPNPVPPLLLRKIIQLSGQVCALIHIYVYMCQ